MVDSLSMAVQAFPMRVFISSSVDDISLPRYVKLSTAFRRLPSSVKISPFQQVHSICTLSYQSLRKGLCRKTAAKEAVLPGRGRISTTVRVYHMDINQAPRE